MRKFLSKIRHSLVMKVVLTSGITLLLCMTLWSWFSLSLHERTLMGNLISETDRLSNTIRLGTHYAMMLDSEDDIRQIVNNISTQPEIRAIRIYDKLGAIRYANLATEQDTETDIEEPVCSTCHELTPPPSTLSLKKRTRKIFGPDGEERLAIVTPIPNEPACWQAPCHAHKETDTLLGLVDVEVTLASAQAQLTDYRAMTIQLTIATVLATFLSLLYFIFHYVNRPITELIEGTRRIARGGLGNVNVQQEDEMGQLADAVNEMGAEVFEKHSALHQQRMEYQELFEGVPCIITVQDKNYNLLSYNKRFSNLFDPQPGDPCYKAYKGLDAPCEDCPVQKTLETGQSQVSEEEGVNKDGSPASWLVTTAPIRNESGEIIAAMEMCLDITHRRQLEYDLQRSEEKYHAIFENIPSPVFVLDAEKLTILDTNDSMAQVYGYTSEDLVDRCFLDLFLPEEREYYRQTLNQPTVLNRVRHRRKDGDMIFVELRLSPAQFGGQKVLLATTGDITKRLETEQQLIQASKMATLGEMATGVAHELNQPLSVIKTASGFFMRKLEKEEPIAPNILQTMSEEIDSHVDRASRIINHLRDFGRKPEMVLEEVDVNQLIMRAYEMFSQQLALRQIDMVWQLSDNLPHINCDPGRLEQVFINLLLNARDAIEERWGSQLPSAPQEERRIVFRSHQQKNRVVVEISDTGPGIPSRHAERIFEPFFTTKKVGKGTGLGLSISYGIIQDCGGSIQACMDDETGAHFVINFPISKK